MKLNIVKNYLTKNRCYQQDVKRTPVGIQLHTIGTGQGTAQAVADYWNQPAVSACVHYIVDCDKKGKVLATLPEDVYAWADAGYGNRSLITFEICESDYIRYTGGASYDILDQERFKADILRGYDTAVLLCADICRRYGWDPSHKLPSGLYLISSHDEGRRAGLSSAHVDPTHVWDRFGLTMDRFRLDVRAAMEGEFETETGGGPEKWYRIRKTWEDAGTQLGAYEVLENAKADCPPGYTVYDWNGKAVYTNTAETSGTQVSEFSGLSETAAAARLLEISRPIAVSYGLFPSVCAAQDILESGYCTTELARRANNVCGMKCMLSGNTWAGSVWDGKSKVNIRTPEQDSNGNTYYVYADFRKYPCIEDSIKDRCAYLLGAKDGNGLRYEGIRDCRDYREQATLIKNGGYATDVNYISKICSIIERFSLDKYDSELSGSTDGDAGDILPDTGTEWYRVRKSWGTDMSGQIGAYRDLVKAKDCADQNPGYSVFDGSGKKIYPEEQAASGNPILDQCKKFQKQLKDDRKAGKDWEYHNPSRYLEEQWGEALKKEKRACNCALLARWALKEAGLIPQETGIFYGKLGGTISWGAGTKAAVTKTCDLIRIGDETVGQLIEDGTLQPGDIVTYVDIQHTNIYAGNGKWYDAGHAYCSGTGEGAVYKSWHGEGQYNSQKAGYIIREKSGSGQYTVQAGSFTVKSNAEKRFRKIKKAGFDVIVKKQDGAYKVQCGVFSVKANAEKLVKKLKKAGFDAIIKS